MIYELLCFCHDALDSLHTDLEIYSTCITIMVLHSVLRPLLLNLLGAVCGVKFNSKLPHNYGQSGARTPSSQSAYSNSQHYNMFKLEAKSSSIMVHTSIATILEK